MPADLSLLAGLPAPQDDGACRHLIGMRLPAIALPSTQGLVDLSALRGRSVLYAYPGAKQPGEPLPSGWDRVPGLYGCTPQACGFRDHYRALLALGAAAVFGISTQTPDEQADMAEWLNLPFPLVSDADLRLAAALRLPTVIVDDTVLLRRVTLILRDGAIEHVLYPVFPPDQSAGQAIAWLQAHPAVTLH